MNVFEAIGRGLVVLTGFYAGCYVGWTIGEAIRRRWRK